MAAFRRAEKYVNDFRLVRRWVLTAWEGFPARPPPRWAMRESAAPLTLRVYIS